MSKSLKNLFILSLFFVMGCLSEFTGDGDGESTEVDGSAEASNTKPTTAELEAFISNIIVVEGLDNVREVGEEVGTSSVSKNSGYKLTPTETVTLELQIESLSLCQLELIDCAESNSSDKVQANDVLVLENFGYAIVTFNQAGDSLPIHHGATQVIDMLNAAVIKTVAIPAPFHAIAVKEAATFEESIIIMVGASPNTFVSFESNRPMIMQLTGQEFLDLSNETTPSEFEDNIIVLDYSFAAVDVIYHEPLDSFQVIVGAQNGALVDYSSDFSTSVSVSIDDPRSIIKSPVDDTSIILAGNADAADAATNVRLVDYDPASASIIETDLTPSVELVDYANVSIAPLYLTGAFMNVDENYMLAGAANDDGVFVFQNGGTDPTYADQVIFSSGLPNADPNTTCNGVDVITTAAGDLYVLAAFGGYGFTLSQVNPGNPSVILSEVLSVENDPVVYGSGVSFNDITAFDMSGVSMFGVAAGVGGFLFYSFNY